MNDLNKIAVVGGDLRQLKLAEGFVKDCFDVRLWGFDKYECDCNVNRCDDLCEAVCGSMCVILPLPLSNDQRSLNCPLSSVQVSLKEVLSAVKNCPAVCAGRVDSNILIEAELMGIPLYDYFEREELQVLNAIPTAEGAIQIAMEETPITLHGSRILILGFGRISKVLSMDLKALGSDVHVAARKYSDLAWIHTYGYKPVHFTSLKDNLGKFDVIFNTVPHKVLDADMLSRIDDTCLIIDLASKPGGVDFDAAKNMGKKVVWSLSLPGKVAPITSGEIIKSTILNILKEQGKL